MKRLERARCVTAALRDAGLTDVRVDADDDGTVYLAGKVADRDEQVRAVEVAVHCGAKRVLEDLQPARMRPVEIERHFHIGSRPGQTAKNGRRTAAQRLLGVDLSHRLFDAPLHVLRNGL